ncbi:Gfo/Idh/MocA family protein [Engelhardtia mirabilis]|uniref:4-carboxy-2-hydroxymuconate-6-semialdehyde dehydrogenase n=1 Tax=Engelhardtia mirabilis TaxID=2528011 RepID=A0A518BLK7_9BACT|nr:4-carboxy-2-hydroxymuconate-6-semialdehyde dehydrogenase [Planctomycetes bacterium Pla133]QDV02185.1 4-carboxy-2-hydroxymuconate-6-semialdehyde dehydrogenase [Planctomycetes bacterium Pla86]
MTTPTKRPIRTGVIGLGFMGRTHLAAYASAHGAGHPNELVAVADRNADRRAGKLSGGGNIDTGAADFDPALVRAYELPGSLLDDESVELVSICTPTETHVDLAIAALAAGKHVLVEKPLALASSEVERLVAAAREAATLCMPAMCIRFWPGWSWLTERVRDGRYGALLGLDIQRLGSRPSWSPGFYSDPARSGGALFDLHVHDVDFVVQLLGRPVGVAASGGYDHVSALYRFAPGADGRPAPRVAIGGGWDQPPGFPFEMSFRAVFEGATAEYSLREAAPLRVFIEDRAEPIELAPHTGYELQVRALLDAIAGGAERPPVQVAEALEVARVLEQLTAELGLDAPGAS